jgi:hypothetical protein
MKPNTTNLQAYRKGVSNLASGVAQCKEQVRNNFQKKFDFKTMQI